MSLTIGSSLLFGGGIAVGVIGGIAAVLGITLAIFTLAVASVIGLIVLWKVIKLSKILLVAKTLKLTVGIDYLRKKFTKSISNECRLCLFITYLIIQKHVSYKDAGKIFCQEYFKLSFNVDKTVECIEWANSHVPLIEIVMNSSSTKPTPPLICSTVIQKSTCRMDISEMDLVIYISPPGQSSSEANAGKESKKSGKDEKKTTTEDGETPEETEETEETSETSDKASEEEQLSTVTAAAKDGETTDIVEHSKTSEEEQLSTVTITQLPVVTTTLSAKGGQITEITEVTEKETDQTSEEEQLSRVTITQLPVVTTTLSAKDGQITEVTEKETDQTSEEEQLSTVPDAVTSQLPVVTTTPAAEDGETTEIVELSTVSPTPPERQVRQIPQDEMYDMKPESEESENDEWDETIEKSIPGIITVAQRSKRSPKKTKDRKLEKLPQKSFNILHLSDAHLSLDYLVGSDDNCGNIVCCKDYLNQPNYKSMAGIWGSFQCDMPKRTFKATLKYISKKHDIDLIYFTGDVVDHAFWNASQSNNAEVIKYFYKALHKAFPKVTILPVLGNHDVSPLNCIPPKGSKKDQISQQWLYNLVTKLWSKWLPPDALKTVRRQGYYTTVVHKGLRIIALNNIVCHVLNYCLFKNPYFLEEQLNWLRDTLVASEEEGEKVHIIAHIPPGHEACVETWEKNYASIISRFKDIIQGQFFGYSHGAELKIFYDVDTGEPINIGFIGGSLTPLPNYHPSFKIYSVDRSTYEILDEKLFSMNLTKANRQKKSKKPKWYSSGSLKSNFNLKNLQPKSVAKMLVKITTDETFFNKYYRYYTRNSDVLMNVKCVAGCEKKVKCFPFTTISTKGPRKAMKICKTY